MSAHLLQEPRGEEVRVEVNQRALVDKVLARYSGEFTLFRELLQNSDDAGSEAVEIRFETTEYQQRAKTGDTRPLTEFDLKSADIVQWTFRNNGKPFDRGDWERLPRIAEGNPSPDKIGAFGVGFYNLFSVTESPCVTSGGYGMRFYWKNNDNQLYVRRGSLLDNEVLDHRTTFQLPLRDPTPMPPVLDLMRFLASSVTFMVKLTDVAVFLDDNLVGQIKKSLELCRNIDVKEDMKRSSPGNIMHVKEIVCQRVTIEAEVVNAAYTSSETLDPSSMEINKSRVDLTVFIAEVDVTLHEKISRELRWRMKKNTPSHIKYSLIYTGKDEYDRSTAEHHPESESIFRGLRADLEGAKYTRIFIGHATGQTTSVGGHMASHFIPTVERESIDFVDNHVSVWNKELLYVGGFLSRAVYEHELSDIQRLWEEAAMAISDSQPLPKVQDDLHQRFLHVLKFFAFHHSTPSQKVAHVLRDSFYECSTLPARLLSSVGVRSAPNIRAFDPQVARFLNSLPMLSEHVSQEAARNIEALPDPHRILPVTVEDVLQALDGHPLSEEKLVYCIQWWLGLKQNDLSLSAAELVHAVTFNGAGGVVHSLSSTEHFIDSKGPGSHIPHDGPLPASLIPFDVSVRFTPAELMNLGRKEFTVVDWFEYISSTDVMSRDPTNDFTKSAYWAERVLYVLSRTRSSLSEEIRRVAKAVFDGVHCIPTSHGLCRPDGSYLPTANDTLFHKLGLPVVALSYVQIDREMEALLLFIGVQTQIPLELLPARMLETGDWSTSDFMGYLVRLSPPLTTEQISMLKSSKLFLEESANNNVGKQPRYCAGELYPPIKIFRQLQLPVVDWDKKSKWLNESDEAELLYRLGLHPYPPLETIIQLCASPDTSVGATAFTYFCEHLRSKYSAYSPDKFQDVAFVPAENKDGTCLKSPRDVFLDIQWKALGFSVVQNTHQKVVIGELGIQQHPPPSMLLHFLETNHPPDDQTARQWFECLSDCSQSFAQHELTRLSELPMVPTGSSGSLKWLAPSQCYLGPSMDPFYSKLFVFVHFSTRADHFLSICGSTKEPSVKDVAESLIQDPKRFYELAGGHDGFLEKLRNLAIQRTQIPNDTLKRMSSQRTLLGERRERDGNQIGREPISELRRPKEIVIIDDSGDYALFGDAIFVAPQEELLECFYSSIGCRRLSKVLREQSDDPVEITDAKTCSEIQTLILQRLPLFLKKCSHSQYDKKRLPTRDNFHVFVCERLLVRKTLDIDEVKTTREQDLWATIKCNKADGIELWLSRHVKRDMYDLAASLCRLLFGFVKINDTVLLAAMLSDVDLLKRAGFDVDQLPEQQPSEFSVDKSYVPSTNAPATSTNVTGDRGSPPQAPLAYIHHAIANTLSNTYHTVKGGLISSIQSSITLENTISLPSPRSPRQIIRQSYIRDTVNKATEACAPGGSHLLDDKDDTIQFLNQQACNDDFAQVKNLRYLRTWEDVEVHVAEDLPDTGTFIAEKQEPLSRFIRIIKPAASAYNLSMRSLHIFYDVCDGSIAFNRKGSIYLNLRYFEEWHDEDVKNGQLRRAQLSWFFVLGHEIAHNLISSHDAAHEFWFSAICEAHMSEFTAAAASSNGEDSVRSG